MFLDLDHETIDDPKFVVEVHTGDSMQRLFVGKDTPYGTLALFKDGLDGVIHPELLKMLERGPTDIGSSKAFPFDEQTLGVKLTGVRQGNLSLPLASQSALRRALEASQLVYQRYPPAWTEAELVVHLKQPKRVDVIEVGPVDADGFRAVLNKAGGAPMRVPADELEALFLEPLP